MFSIFFTGWRLLAYTMAGSELGFADSFGSSASRDDTCPESLNATSDNDALLELTSKFVDDFLGLSSAVSTHVCRALLI